MSTTVHFVASWLPAHAQAWYGAHVGVAVADMPDRVTDTIISYQRI